MFNHENLKEIIKLFKSDTGKPEYFEQMLDWPLADINFDKDYQENIKKYLIDKPIDTIVDNIPLAKSLPPILLDAAKKSLSFIGSMAADKSIQFIVPGFYVFLNVFIEICKSNMNLDQFENELFYKKLEDLNEITTSVDYIDYKYTPDQGEQVKESLIEKIKKIPKRIFMKTKEEKEEDKAKKETKEKFESFEKDMEKKLQLLGSYKPRHVSENLKILHIIAEKENIDYCLYHLKFDLYGEDKLGNLLKDQLIDLRESYDIVCKLSDGDMHTINFISSKDKSFTIDMIKERLFRFLLLNGLLIKKLIKPCTQSNSEKSQGSISSNFLKEEIGDKYISIIDFESVYSKFMNEKKKKILIYGPKGFGKTIFASQFGIYFCQKVENDKNICISFEIGSKENIIADYVENMTSRLSIDKSTTQKTNIDLINQKLGKESKVFLLIFDGVNFSSFDQEQDDNVDPYTFIEPVMRNLPTNVFVLITSRISDATFLQHFDSTELIREFNREEACEFFNRNLNRGKDKIESIMVKLDEIEKNIKSTKFIPLKLERIKVYINKKKSPIEAVIKSINLKDVDIYGELFDQLLNKENTEESKHLICVLAFLYFKRINFKFLNIIIDDDELIYTTLKKLIYDSILYDELDKDEIFFNIPDTLQIELFNYLSKKELKKQTEEKLVDMIYNHFISLKNGEFATVQLYDLDHFIAIISKGDKDSKTVHDCFNFLKKNSEHLANYYKTNQKYENAISYYEKLIKIERIEKENSAVHFYELYSKLEFCHSKIANETEANFYKNKAFKVKENGSIPKDYTVDLESISKAQNPFNEIIPKVDELKIYRKKAEVIYNIGLNAKRVEQFYEAFNFFLQSLNIYKEKVYTKRSDDPEIITKLKNNLIVCYQGFEKSKNVVNYEQKLQDLNEIKKNLKIDYEKKMKKLQKKPESIACTVL